MWISKVLFKTRTGCLCEANGMCPPPPPPLWSWKLEVEEVLLLAEAHSLQTLFLMWNVTYTKLLITSHLKSQNNKTHEDQQTFGSNRHYLLRLVALYDSVYVR
jgi:hypothetical protein